MKAFCTAVLICAIPCTSAAQNWQCIQPNQKVYFKNYSGYLRGMRIDSTHTTASATTWYPFHSPRGGDYLLNNSVVDPNGGSWLGRSIIAQTNGITFFLNEIGDTVIIDSRAGLGSQWVFYSDTSSRWFQATVISADTLTIAGVVDSVKRIGIQGKVGNANAFTINNTFDILLSKNHGIIRAFDLDIFPFPEVFTSGTMDYLTGVITVPSAFSYADLSFSRFELQNVTGNTIFDYQPGDVFQYDVTYNMNTGSIFTDTILTRQNAGNWINYTIRRHENNDSIINGQHIRHSVSGTYAFQTSYLPFVVDTNLMPEETGTSWFYRYYPDDTMQCITAPVYQRAGCNIDWNTNNAHGLGYCRELENFKPGLGWLDHYHCDASNEYEANFVKYLHFTRKNNIPCGTLAALSIASPVENAAGFAVYPNPANADATITLNFPSGVSATLVTVLDLNGRMLYSTALTGNAPQTISTVGWPAGIYTVKLQTRDGITCRKLVIAH